MNVTLQVHYITLHQSLYYSIWDIRKISEARDQRRTNRASRIRRPERNTQKDSEVESNGKEKKTQSPGDKNKGGGGGSIARVREREIRAARWSSSAYSRPSSKQASRPENFRGEILVLSWAMKRPES